MNPRVFLFVLLLVAGARAAQPVSTQYVPMKVIQTDEVIFPRRATESGVTSGKVQVSIQVDENGKLTDQLVTAYTHPLLAESAVQALKRWRYEPAWVNGRPRSATVDLIFEFESHGMVVVDMTVHSYVQMRDFRLRPSAYAYGVHTLRQLDRIPTPTKVVQPAYPAVSGQGTPPVITVQFFIDEKGKVRLPAVSREASEANDAFAAAAVNAVSQWEFEPPLSKGVPVLVAARQDFNFGPSRRSADSRE